MRYAKVMIMITDINQITTPETEIGKRYAAFGNEEYGKGVFPWIVHAAANGGMGLQYPEGTEQKTRAKIIFSLYETLMQLEDGKFMSIAMQQYDDKKHSGPATDVMLEQMEEYVAGALAETKEKIKEQGKYQLS